MDFHNGISCQLFELKEFFSKKKNFKFFFFKVICRYEEKYFLEVHCPLCERWHSISSRPQFPDFFSCLLACFVSFFSSFFFLFVSFFFFFCLVSFLFHISFFWLSFCLSLSVLCLFLSVFVSLSLFILFSFSFSISYCLSLKRMCTNTHELTLAN